MNKKLEGLRNNLLFKLNAIGDYSTHKEMWDAFYEYEKELRQPAVMQRSEQVAFDCNYCGRLYGDAMCKLHPAPCKKH
jgi:hypothetical protein